MYGIPGNGMFIVLTESGENLKGQINEGLQCTWHNDKFNLKRGGALHTFLSENATKENQNFFSN